MKARSIWICLPVISFLLFACGGQPAQENEDDVLLGGKADGAGFEYGFFYNYDYTDGAPMVIVFHNNTKGAPAGYAGQFDYSVYSEADGDYTTKNQSGYFKLYRSRGVNRIRLDTYDGTLIGKFDWSFKDGDLNIGEYTLNGQIQGSDPAPIRECYAVEVYDFVLEEGFTVWEYPNCYVEDSADGKKVAIGMSVYYASDGNKIEFSEMENGFFEAKVTTEYGEVILMRVPADVPSRGEVWYGSDGENPHLIAKTICFPPPAQTVGQ